MALLPANGQRQEHLDLRLLDYSVANAKRMDCAPRGLPPGGRERLAAVVMSELRRASLPTAVAVERELVLPL